MNFTEADDMKCNPHFSDPDAGDQGYWINCQTCTVAYELRRRGFNIEALPNKNNELYNVWCVKNNFNWNDRFLNLDGTRPVRKCPLQLSDRIKAKEDFIENNTKETGRYEVYMEWKGKDAGAHVFIVERQKNGSLLWFDPQTGKHGSSTVFKGYLKQAKPRSTSVLRIDDKIINSKFAERFKKASE